MRRRYPRLEFLESVKDDVDFRPEREIALCDR